MGDIIGEVVLFWDGEFCVGAPWELGGEVLEGRRAAVVFVCEAEDGVQTDLVGRPDVSEWAESDSVLPAGAIQYSR